MKGSAVLSVALFLTISSVFAQSLSIDPNAGRLQLSSLLQHSVGKILSEFGHAAIAKRQTVYDINTQDVVDCVSKTIEYQCGSSGYSQKVVDIATDCKNDSYARNTANTCARNDKGETCGAVALKFLSGQTNAESCLGSVANEFCSSECREFLQSAKDSLGCCLNAYVNKTDYPLFREYREQVDHRLWDLCEVDLPEEECKDSGIKVEFLNDVKSCTSQEILTNFVRYECSADIGQSLVDNLMKNDRCYIFSAVMVDACSSNENGRYCAEIIGTDLMNTFGTDPYVIALNSDCGARDPDSGCNPACKESINAIKKVYGCCVNVYNDSSIGLQLGALSYSVWNECEIESPGFCQQTQTIPTKPPVPTPQTEGILIPTDIIPEITTERVPVTQPAPPIVSSDRPDIGVIVATEFIPETTQPEVVTENIVSTEETEIIEETESTQPGEPTESTPLEPDVITENIVSTEETEIIGETESTQPEEPTESTSLEPDVVTENIVSTEGTEIIEETESTQPGEPTESTPLEPDVVTENIVTEIIEDTESTQPGEPTESTPLEEIETTQPEENEPITDEEDIMETSAPPVSREDDTESADTAAAPQTTQSIQSTEPTQPTSNTENSESIDSTEASHATDHQVQTESTQPEFEPSTASQSASESIPSTEATESTHPSDHSETASLPTVSSEANENVQMITNEDSDGDHSAQTESSGPPSGGQSRSDLQAFNDSVPSARALFSAVIAIGVVVTVFIQQL